MHLCALALSNFRLYKEAYFEFEKGVNGITGNNAVGKTSILEAIYVALCGRSFRTPELKNLIREGQEAFVIELTFIKNEIEQKLSITQGLERRRIFYNNTPFSSYTSLLGIIQGVLFAPRDLDLIEGPPLKRRNFLDMQLAQVDPLYVHHLQRYMRAMKQRNFLLKTKNNQAIQSFEKEMAISAAYLVKQRIKSLQDLSRLSGELFNSFSHGREKISLKYQMEDLNEDLESYYIRQFQKMRAREEIFGYTLIGPHKDNFSILIDEKEAKTFASEGQKHSAIAALKFAEWSLIAEKTEDKPLMMIDDLTLSLDASRQSKMCLELERGGQAYFSSTFRPLFSSAIHWISL